MAAETWGISPKAFPTRETFATPGWIYLPDNQGAASGSVTRSKRGLTVVAKLGGSVGRMLAFASCERTKWN